MPPLRRKINQRSARILILSFLTHRGRLSFYFIFGPPAGLVQQVCALSAPRTGDAERTVEIKPLSLSHQSVQLTRSDALSCRWTVPMLHVPLLQTLDFIPSTIPNAKSACLVPMTKRVAAFKGVAGLILFL
jgi:hypothetical protein